MNKLQLAQQLKENLETLGDYLTQELRNELAQQGHKATGSLINSIDYEVEFFKKELSLAISYLSYGVVMDKGVSPQRIPFGKGGGSVSKYINALMDWIKQKGIETKEKNIKSFAFAIAQKHKKEGLPTRGSYKFSKNNRRLGFQKFVINDNQEKIEDLIGKDLAQAVSFSFDDIISKIQKIV